MPRPKDDPLDLILDNRARQAGLSGVVVHRPRDHKDLAAVRRHGIRTTTIGRTLLDLGAVDSPAVHGTVGHVLASRQATLGELLTFVQIHARPGRRGVVALRAALDGWAIDGKPADSVLELAMNEVRQRFGLPPMQFHALVEGYEVDFLVCGTNVVLECDGWTSHGLDRDQFEFDRARRAAVTAGGFVIVEFIYRQVTRQPATVVARINAVLAKWAPDVAG